MNNARSDEEAPQSVSEKRRTDAILHCYAAEIQERIKWLKERQRKYAMHVEVYEELGVTICYNVSSALADNITKDA